MARYAVIADDLTGAGDAGVQFAAAGLRTRTLLGWEKPGDLRGVDVAVVDTASRGLPGAAAYTQVRAVAAQLQAAGAAILYKKIDSTLRGPVGAEIDAVLDVCGAPLAVVCPAYPAQRRIVAGGVVLVDGIPVAQTAIGRDPITPLRESSIVRLLASQSRFPVLHLDAPYHLAAGNSGSLGQPKGEGRIVVCDAQNEADLAAIVAAAEALAAAGGGRALLVGAGGLARALASSSLKGRGSTWQRPPGGTHLQEVIVACGSLHPAARAQLRALTAAPRRHVTVLATPEPEEEIRQDQAGQDQARAGADPQAAVARLAAAVRARLDARAGQGEQETQAMRAVGAQALVVTGGDTLAAVLRALAARGVDLEEEIAPGVPAGRLFGGPWAGLRIVSKAGGFGPPDLLLEIVAYLAQR
jgi:uncharacterized protein YgbK (DUF1537 family)